MITPTSSEARAVLTILEPAQYARLVRVVMGLRTPEQWKAPLKAYHQLQMYAYEWLVHLGFLSDDKVRWLLSAVDMQLRAFGGALDNVYDDLPVVKVIPSFVLTVTDQRYAVWLGCLRLSDLQEEQAVSQMDEAGCTHVTGDFLAIFIKKQKWLKRLQGGKDAAGHQHHAAGPADAGAGGQDEEPGGGKEAPPG